MTVHGPGVVKNIDHSGATNSAGYTFVLDAHNHGGGGPISDVTYHDLRVVNSQDDNPINVKDAGPGVDDVAYEDIPLVDSRNQ